MSNKEAVRRLLLLLGKYKKQHSCDCWLSACFYRIKSLCAADQQADHG